MMTRLLWRSLLPALVVAVLVFLVTSILPKVYASYETLYFPLNPSGGVGALGPLAGAPSGMDVGAPSGLGGAVEYPLIGSGSLTAASIVNSHTCRVFVAQELNLPQAWHLDILKAADKLGKQIDTETDRSGLLLIRVNSDSPARCVEINDAIHRHLLQRTAELSQNASAGNRRLIQERLDLAEKKLARDRANMVSVLRNTPLAEVDQLQHSYFAARDALSSATQSREAARARLSSIEAQYAKLQANRNLGPRVSLLTTLNPTFSELATELQKRRLTLEDAMAKFTESSPELSIAKQSFRNAQNLTGDVVAGASSGSGASSPELISARAELAALSKSVAVSEKTLAGFEQNLKQSPRQFADSQIAKHQFSDTLEEVASLKHELERANIMQERDPMRFAVVDAPYEDPIPVAPRRLLYTVLAFVLVLLLTLLPFLAKLLKSVAVPEESGRPMPHEG